MWQILFGVFLAVQQLFINAPQAQPAYDWLTPECRQYVGDNIWQIRYVPAGEPEDPRYRGAVAYITARTAYISDHFLSVPLDYQAFILVHEAYHAEQFRREGDYGTEEQADNKAWQCWWGKMYGW